MKVHRDESLEAARRAFEDLHAGHPGIHHGECIGGCGRGFNGTDVLACCTFATEYGEAWSDGDERRMPFVRHIDGYCRDCCTCPGAIREQQNKRARAPKKRVFVRNLPVRACVDAWVMVPADTSDDGLQDAIDVAVKEDDYELANREPPTLEPDRTLLATWEYDVDRDMKDPKS